MARIRFTPAQGVDVSDADAAVGDVKDPKTFYSVAAPKKTGTMPTVAIVAANDNYPAGYHAGNVGGLDAIDTDLAPENIKKDVVIFGKTGTFESTLSGTELWPEAWDTTGNADWENMPGASGDVPATALKVYLWCTAAYNAQTRVLYDGVEKCLADESESASWYGDALGSLATVQGRQRSKVGPTTDQGGGSGAIYFELD